MGRSSRRGPRMNDTTYRIKRALILCTGNSCRSQMAEALWWYHGGDRLEAFSAGSRPAGYVHPIAVEAMREVGVDISAQESKHVNEFAGQPFDLVVTVCDHAQETCPTFPRAKLVVHWPFDDPAEATGTAEEVLAEFRRVRDQIKETIDRHVAP